MSDVVDTGQVPAETATAGAETDETGAANMVTAETAQNAPETTPDGNTDNSADATENAEDTIRKLRKENADRRTKAKAAEERADVLAKRLHTALVTATNRLENSADLPFDAEHLADPDKLGAAIDALLGDRPYMAKRVVRGDAGQGARGGSADGGVNLVQLLKGL
jgi:hypothetical protein